ncbi:Serine/threonine-protein kinase PknD [Streptomyces sp. RB5]|uniref:Serine/threonine-protein kinase PknD n=1 Tax=Streptomyces smaragdinus TaxID=2585196 RepID=A0A7K0CG28_9ACTN|nr:protein kinase [Streptomyces smaragdinus]MQY12408.1 Serine/threonine-protein kinase PknD [Streptomyces smaragdinus]
MRAEWTGTGAVRPGELIGPYTVLDELASGGMGRVYLARSPGGRTVAVKTLLGTSDEGTEVDRRRFAREVAVARRVRGLYTAGVVDADAEAPVPWMATEYIPAPSLRELVAAHGPLPAGPMQWVAAGMAEALVSLHEAGLVHRDIKPSNVLLPEDGPRLIDFGISQAGDLTRTGAVLGTIAFAAPEQVRGEATTTATDVFSLGATLFYLVAGRSPYRDMGTGTAVEQLVRAAECDLDLTGLPAAADALIRPCLAASPAERPTPEDLLARVGPALAARPDAHGAAGWLPESWSTAIVRHRGRRIAEAEAARRRIDPEGVTERTPPAYGAHPAYGAGPGTRPMPAPAERPARASGFRLVASLVAGGLLVTIGAVYAITYDGGGGGAPDPVRQDLRLVLVEQNAAGKCANKLPPPTFDSKNPETCYAISTRAEDRMSVTQLKDVRAAQNEQGTDWMVQMSFEKTDARHFATLTGKAAGRESPKNQIAIILGDTLISAPVVTAAITGGEVEISGSFTRDDAEKLARDLGAPS